MCGKDEVSLTLPPWGFGFQCIMLHQHRKKIRPMSTFAISIAHATPSQLGESPLWDPDEAVLYWVDITGKCVNCLDPATESFQSWPLPCEPGCIARAAGNALIVAGRDGIFRFDTRTGNLDFMYPPPYDASLMRFNDGRCDSAGRFWMGTAYDSRDKQAGSLFCMERGHIRDLKLPVTVSNGVAFSIDNKTLYHADTTAHRISAYDFDLATGSLKNGRLFKQFSRDKGKDYGGRPDGAAVDSENAYWCALYEGGRLLRLAPDGEILLEVPLPVRCPTMMAFGGPDLRTLYITTVRHKRPAEELHQFPLSGCVLSLRADVPGLPENTYLS